ncbi:MAG: bifunctional UDP-sugar hydrolase/5'-nucleotidase [Deltaproteobacteria bacterium]
MLRFHNHRKRRSRSWLLILIAVTALSLSTQLFAAEKVLTLIHTNDLHSHLLGFSPQLDYTPLETGNDETVGGWARVAAVIQREKMKRKNPVLVLDAGDFLMGSLFHMVSREESVELRLMGEMGYDVTTLGNHEFDLRPSGLARIIASATSKGKTPQIVFSSALFSSESREDDSLEKIFAQEGVKPYTIIEKEGLRIGVFGIMGRDAAEVSPFAVPVAFKDPIEAAKDMVRVLREDENVDLVICLSHSGLGDGKRESEDEELVKAVKGIDIVISGHSHTTLETPIVSQGAIIVQAGSYGKYVGVLDVGYENRVLKVKDYALVRIDDTVKGDPGTQGQINAFIGCIDEQVLKGQGLTFWQVVARTDFDLTIGEEESNLGNLITDAVRWAVNRYDSHEQDPISRVAFAVESLGLIRDPILKGKTGKLTVCDIFNAIPLGIGMDDTMGYPLVSFYLYGSEIKRALEILTSIYPMKGHDYFLQVSGLRFRYNPHRVIFDRVTDIQVGSEEEGYKPLDYSGSSKRLYRCAGNIYNATFLKIVGRFTWHILDIVPKDRNGSPIADLKAARVDADKKKTGIQELKEWVAVIDYIRSFSEEGDRTIAGVPEKYRSKSGRIVVEASWNPVDLLKRGNHLTWCASGLLIVIAFAVLWLVRFTVRKFRKPDSN